MDLGAYLQQDDVFWESYTCRELFYEAANFRTSMSHDEITQAVENMV